jgi:hypothetical protein
MDVISAFLRNHYVEVYSAIVDLRYAVYLLLLVQTYKY